MAHQLEDFKVNIRIKLALLWTSIMFCYIYGDYFELYVPGKVSSLISGENNLDTPFKLFFATILLTISGMMIFLSLVLKPILAKWTNIGVGIFFTLFTFTVGVSSLSEWRVFYVFLSFLESFLTLMITFIAWNWAKVNME